MIRTVGEALIAILEENGVEVVFGIPGVHTIELYRGLAASPIRHVTPRHEQGAGFMADGYARVSGRPGVCLLITGPGLTNALTAMAQARADSIPVIVITGVNRRSALGRPRGALHELPDQLALTRSLASFSHTLLDPAALPEVMAHAFAILESARPGPVHIEIPVDVMAETITYAPRRITPRVRPAPEPARVAARQPVIILGGGAREAKAALPALAERLDAPAVTTINARDLLVGHPLQVPASPSLPAVRRLLAEADLVLALGTELGATDFDMYEDGGFPILESLVRIDIDAAQLARGPAPRLAILSSAASGVAALLDALPPSRTGRAGIDRAERARLAAKAGLTERQRREVAVIETIHAALPGCIIVGDSTQPVYAGNLYGGAGQSGRWFNSATGYGALGYAPSAATGAAIAAPGRPVLCLVGDGGLQFALAELGTAADAGAAVIFLVWNNQGYREIETCMRDAGITPEGVKPTPPDFLLVATSYGIEAERLASLDDLPACLERAWGSGGPSLIELPEALVHG